MHKLSTAGGNSGSPIYCKNADNCYLFGIHTTGIKAFNKDIDVENTNYGTYIYSR